MSAVYRALVQTFPNFEVRHTLTKVRSPRVEHLTPFPESKAESVDRQSEKSGHLFTLDISGKLAESIEIKPRAASQFGTDARRHLLRSGAALDEHDPRPESKLFLTGTLPGSTPQAMKAIADYADFIVKRVKDWLDYYQEERLDFYVWELQKRGALHIHYCAYLPEKEEHESVKRKWHNYWCDTLDAVGNLSGCNMYKRGFGDARTHDRSAVQTRAETVGKSVAAYLSKYVSKTSNGISKFNQKYAPRRWWGRSRPLKALTDSLSTVTEMVFSSLQKGLTYIRNIHDDLEGMSVRQYSYRHTAGVGETFISYAMRNSWQMVKNILSLRSTGMLTEYGKKSISASKTISLLNRLTENFYQFGKSSRVGSDPSWMQSLRVVKSVQSSWRDSGFGCVRAWINNLVLLSSSATCMKIYRWDPRMEQDPNLHPIKELWRLRELIWSFENPTWEDIKICDRYLDKIGWSLDVGTKPIDDGKGDSGETEPSSLPGVKQLELFFE